jgi:hypothetical protein
MGPCSRPSLPTHLSNPSCITLVPASLKAVMGVLSCRAASGLHSGEGTAEAIPNCGSTDLINLMCEACAERKLQQQGTIVEGTAELMLVA